MAQLYLNNAYAKLTADLSSTATTFALAGVTNFPAALASGDWFFLTIYRSSSRYGENVELVKVIAWDGVNVTVERGQEDTFAVAHSQYELVESRLTAGSIQPLDDKLALIEDGAQVNTVDTVDGRTGAVDLTDRYEQKRFSNYAAITNPGLTDDETQGYEPMSRWINTSTGELWLCINAATGGANWQKATLTLDELGSAAVADVGTGADQLPRNSNLGSASLAATTDFEPVGTVAAHEAEADPHAQYTTQPEANAIAVSKAIAFSIALG